MVFEEVMAGSLHRVRPMGRRELPNILGLAHSSTL